LLADITYRALMTDAAIDLKKPVK